MNLVTGELAAMEKLRAPFPASETGQLPRGGTTLAYVGHAAITGRLLDVDPAWNWEPVAVDEDGLPIFLLEGGKPVGFWIRLTVCGVTRLGFGSCPPNQFDAVKVLVGDALRNAAMRFGVALDLWVKGSPELPQDSEPERPYMSGMNVAAFLAKCAKAGATPSDVDAIVLQATNDRTRDAIGVFADEVTVLRAALESWVSERLQATERFKANDAETDRRLESQELGEPVDAEGLRKAVRAGKSVPKRPLPQTEGVTDLKVPSEVV